MPDAAGKVNVRLEDYEDQLAVSSKILESRQQAYTQWVDKYSKKYGKEPLKTDRYAGTVVCLKFMLGQPLRFLYIYNICTEAPLTLKAPITTAADDKFNLSFW